MSDHDEEIDSRLARLRDATDAVRPHPHFAIRVAAKIAREGAGPDWFSDLLRPARRFLPIAAVAAAAGVLLATQSATARRDAQGMAGVTELDTEW